MKGAAARFRAQNNNGWINWTNTHGFGMNVNGINSTDANDYPAPLDPGNGSLFRGQPVATAGTNTINVSGVSTINTGVFGTVSFGALNLGSNASLTVTTPGTVTFTGATTLAGGNTITNSGTVVLSGQVSGVA